MVYLTITEILRRHSDVIIGISYLINFFVLLWGRQLKKFYLEECKSIHNEFFVFPFLKNYFVLLKHWKPKKLGKIFINLVIRWHFFSRSQLFNHTMLQDKILRLLVFRIDNRERFYKDRFGYGSIRIYRKIYFQYLDFIQNDSLIP